MRYLCLLLILSINLRLSAGEPQYSRARVWLDMKSPMQLAATGIDISEGQWRKGVYFTGEFSADEIKRIRSAGFRVEILIEDLQKHFLESKYTVEAGQKVMGVCPSTAPVYTDPFNFSLGSMSGFYYYNEMLQILDDMRALYPNLISVKQEIDTTHSIEGRPVWYVRISDNADVQEAEPRVLYTAVHHAREPIGMTQLIYFMWYLLENYSVDDEITDIVNSTELYFIPCLNPDGYIYNETTNPLGGGFWRKNRRNNGDGTFGVDLNRNYGFNWGFDDVGSSPDGFMDSYRGTGPFSEPETQAIRNFTDSMDFLLALNYHAFGNLLIYPWGHLPDLYTPDSAVFSGFGQLLTMQNHYLYGTGNQTVQYTVNGGSDDWMYGEQVLKPKIFAMTPEVGGQLQGFWPQFNDIIPLCHQTMFTNMTLAHLAGPYAEVEDMSPYFAMDPAGFVYIKFKSVGLDSTATFTVSIQPLSANIASAGTPLTFINPPYNQILTDSIQLQLDAAIQQGDEIKYVVSWSTGQYSINDTVIRKYGLPATAFNDSANAVTAWTGGWNVDNTAYLSPPSSFSDSPFGTYQPSTTNDYTGPLVSLNNAIAARLTFFAKWEIEQDFDYAQVLLSPDNGTTWIPLCGKYTVEGTASQDAGNPVYEGRQLSWVKEEIDLSDYAGMNIRIRFRMSSDVFGEYDGFYIDDIRIDYLLATSAEQITIPDFTMYPIPAADVLYINAEAASRYVIYDPAGKVVYDMPASSSVNIGFLDDGLYIMKVIYDRGEARKYFIKASSK